MVNRVFLIGNLGQDPELRRSLRGTAVVNLNLATSERRKDGDGQYQPHTEWHRIVVFGRTAEIVDQYCKKGQQLFIEGRLQTRSWEDEQGKRRYRTEVLARLVQFLGRPRRAAAEDEDAIPTDLIFPKKQSGAAGERDGERSTPREREYPPSTYSEEDIPY